MQDGIDAMKRYYSEEAWERYRKYYEEGPSREWRDFYRDAAALLEADPASNDVQALGERWLNLYVRAWSGDPDVQTDSPQAWHDREHWPAAMKRRLAEFRVEEVAALLQRAGTASRRKYYGAGAWERLLAMRRMTPDQYSAFWQAHVDLFHEADRALRTCSGSNLQSKWVTMLESDSGGDPEILEGQHRFWAERRNWPAPLRWQVEGMHRLTHERIVAVVDNFEGEATAVRSPRCA